MEPDLNKKSKITYIAVLILLVIITSVAFITGLFWYQSNLLSSSVKTHIDRGQDTAHKASVLQKQINNKFKQQEDFLKNLDQQ
ncbi:MAG: hypothetical protein ABII23_04100 [bacterium]